MNRDFIFKRNLLYIRYIYIYMSQVKNSMKQMYHV